MKQQLREKYVKQIYTDIKLVNLASMPNTIGYLFWSTAANLKIKYCYNNNNNNSNNKKAAKTKEAINLISATPKSFLSKILTKHIDSKFQNCFLQNKLFKEK